MKEYDVIVIGSGIAGMTAAIYLKRANINALIIESSAPGGQLLKSSSIENYPGFKNITGPELAYNIFEQVRELKIDYLYEELKTVDFNKNIVTTTNNDIKYKYLIIATGRRERKLDLRSENELIGKGISYCALCDGNLYKNKDIAIVGSGASAVEESLYLSSICNKVYLIVRGDVLKAEERMKDLVKEKSNIEILYNSKIKDYELLEDKLSSIILSNDTKININGLFISVGRVPNSEMFDLDKKNNYIKVDKNCKTSIDNVYACGDIILKNIYQLTTASSEGTIAASEIIKRINNE